MSCKRCNTDKYITIVEGSWGPHKKKKVCQKCGKWVCWYVEKNEEYYDKQREKWRMYAKKPKEYHKSEEDSDHKVVSDIFKE